MCTNTLNSLQCWLLLVTFSLVEECVWCSRLWYYLKAPKHAKTLGGSDVRETKHTAFLSPRSTSKLPKQPCTSARSDVSVCGEDKLGSDWHYLSTFPQIFSFFHPFEFPIPKLGYLAAALTTCIVYVLHSGFYSFNLSCHQNKEDMICRTKQQGKLQGRQKLTEPTAQ